MVTVQTVAGTSLIIDGEDGGYATNYSWSQSGTKIKLTVQLHLTCGGPGWSCVGSYTVQGRVIIFKAGGSGIRDEEKHKPVMIEGGQAGKEVTKVRFKADCTAGGGDGWTVTPKPSHGTKYKLLQFKGITLPY